MWALAYLLRSLQWAGNPALFLPASSTSQDFQEEERIIQRVRWFLSRPDRMWNDVSPNSSPGNRFSLEQNTKHSSFHTCPSSSFYAFVMLMDTYLKTHQNSWVKMLWTPAETVKLLLPADVTGQRSEWSPLWNHSVFDLILFSVCGSVIYSSVGCSVVWCGSVGSV